MDRFIAANVLKSGMQNAEFKIQYGQIYSFETVFRVIGDVDLKSSMDRFIDSALGKGYIAVKHLKSSMDRFIAVERNKLDEVPHI